MDIIQEFESKIKIIGWEKVYSAREVMKIFWYDKWERFLWAIHRAMSEIIEQKKRDENFVFITDRATWGRPKEDVLLTLWACYFVLQKCDDRKENVIILKEYLNEILSQKKYNQKNNTFFKNINMEKIFVIFSVVFLIFSVMFYVKNYTDFLYVKNSSNILQYTVTHKELSEQKNKQEIVLKEYDQKIFSPDSSVVSPQIILTPQNILKDYITQIPFQWVSKSFELWEYQKFIDGFNLRTTMMQTFSWVSLVEAYFELWNNKAYRDSCSLLSTKMCLSWSKTNLIDFSNFWEKTLAWYNVKEVKLVQESDEKNIYCVQYRYKLKNDVSNESITETFNFTTQKKWWYEQIVWRFCEKIDKWWRQIKCPFELQTYYCK